MASLTALLPHFPIRHPTASASPETAANTHRRSSMKILALFVTILTTLASSVLTVSADDIAPPQSVRNLNAMDSPVPPVFEAKLDGIYMNGEPFTIKGTSYFGLETSINVPFGLWGGNESTTIQKIAELLRNNSFNSIRLPFAVDAVLANIPIDPYLVYNEVELTKAFEGKTLRFLDVVDYTLKVFADNKIVVMLDAHVLSAELGITALWYTSDADKDNFENAWKIMATRYKDTWNVFAADLKNEPHDEASWGSGDEANDWRLTSLKLATTVLEIAPRWLIFVEGMQFSSRDVDGLGCFWGENLMDLQRANLTLPVENRLVFSPHVYGPDVYPQTYFSDPTFPDNMPAIWDLHFGFVQNTYGPLVVGEWGGKYRSDPDKNWQNKFAAYLKERNIGWFYWCVDGVLGETEGLIETDWNTPRQDKFDLLSIFTGTPIP